VDGPAQNGTAQDGTAQGKAGDAGLGKGASEAAPDDERIIAPLSSFRSEPRESRWPREFWNQTQDLLISLHDVRP
jgi:hypothetical protein